MIINNSQWKNLTGLFIILISVAVSPTGYAQRKTSSASTNAHKATRIGFVMNGKLMTQIAAGPAREATASEKQQWRTLGPPPMVSLISPDGKYKIVTNDVDADQAGFHVVQAQNGQRVLGPDAIYSQMGRAGFDGWLPDSQHIAIWAFDHIAGLNGQRRYILDIKTGRKIRFNGWISNDGVVAIVLGQETEAAETSGRQDSGGYKDSAPVHFYATQMPSRLLQYHFPNQAHKELVLNNEPFTGLRKLFGLLFCMPDDHLIRHPQCVEFSPDHQWAICHGRFYAEHALDTYDVDYLVSLRTGRVQKLRGTQARFL